MQSLAIVLIKGFVAFIVKLASSELRFFLVHSSRKEMELMVNNTFCTGLSYACHAAVMRDRSRMLPISLQEVFVVFIGMIHLNLSKLVVALTHGDSVPIFNGSPPL